VKALTAGYGTDSSQYTGGRALQKEDIGSADLTQEDDEYEEAVSKLITAVSKGQVNTLDEAQDYLSGLGLTSLISLDVIRELIKNSKEITEVIPMAKGSLFEKFIDNIKKSMSGEAAISKAQDTEPDPDDDQDGDGGDGGDDTINATEIIKALTDEVEALVQGQEQLTKAIQELVEMNKKDAEFKKSIGEGLIAVMETTEKIAGSPASRRGATSLNEAGLSGIQKGNLGNGGATQRRHRQLTINDRNDLMPIINKAVEEKELDIMDAGKLETQINKSINNPNFQIEPRLLAFLEKKLPKSAAA
jgi:hypothetical protein